jgi:hypothetical protein
MKAVLGRTITSAGFFMLWHDESSYTFVGKRPLLIPVCRGNPRIVLPRTNRDWERPLAVSAL